MKARSPHGFTGFTLVELLVVVAVVGLLFAVALPLAGKVRESAHQTKCASNLRNIGVLVHRYASENNGSFPRSRLQYRSDSSGQKRTVPFLPDLFASLYFPTQAANELNPIWWCPGDRERPLNTRKHSYGHNQRLGGEKASPTMWDGQPNPEYDPRYTSFQTVERPLSSVIFLIEYVDRNDAKWSNAVTGGRWPMIASSVADAPPAAGIDFSRHGKVANALMLDGSVRGFHLEELLHTGSEYFSPEVR